MNIIAHRRNTVKELLETPREYGVEVDIRSFGTTLTIHHDPFIEGENFEQWISEYKHGTLILNIKEEGLETRLIPLMQKHNIEDYFFLDQSFPFLVKWAKLQERRCAVRVSEFESIETALSLAGMIDWVWVDCFTKFPLSASDAQTLKENGFKLCLVSPELQGRTSNADIQSMQKHLISNNIVMDAVCTKRPDLWRQ